MYEKIKISSLSFEFYHNCFSWKAIGYNLYNLSVKAVYFECSSNVVNRSNHFIASTLPETKRKM